MSKPSGHIRDIQDGRVYKKFSEQDHRARGRKIFSIVASSDGAPMIKSRKYSVWPIMCFLVELPPYERYKYKNIILSGLWYGKEKPNVPLFLKRFVEELNVLANGCEFEDDTGHPIPAICRIQSIVPDLPAKAMLFNIKQYNGVFGCSTCKHSGTYVQEFRTRLYDYTSSYNMLMRTAEESREYAELAESTGSTIFGFKGDNVFGQLVLIPDNLPLDWMHCVCEGILKRQLFSRWLDHKFHEEQYSLSEFNKELDELFLSIKVPHDFTRKPRSFSDRKHWKASEFRLFVLFAGLPCLRHAVLSEAFSVDHFYHFALLVTALRYLHSVPVSSESVKAAQVLLDNFVRLLPILYSRKESTYNSHALLHFSSQVLDNGSLSFTSAFVFESFIAHLKNMFTGTRGIPKQMVEKLGISQGYRKIVNNNCSDNSAKRFAQHLLNESPNIKKTEGGIKLYEPIKYRKLHQNYDRELIASFGGEPDSEYLVSYRMKKENETFHSTMYPRKAKSCSYIVQYSQNGRLVYGKVVCYVLHCNTAYALILKYNQTGMNVCQEMEAAQDLALREIVQQKLIGQHFIEVEDTDNLVIVKCNKVENRCMYIPSINGKGFLTGLDTAYEHD